MIQYNYAQLLNATGKDNAAITKESPSDSQTSRLEPSGSCEEIGNIAGLDETLLLPGEHPDAYKDTESALGTVAVAGGYAPRLDTCASSSIVGRASADPDGIKSGPESTSPTTGDSSGPAVLTLKESNDSDIIPPLNHSSFSKPFEWDDDLYTR